MEPVYKKVIALIIVLFIAALAYYGTFLPWLKSKTFIKTMATVGASPSLADFKKSISVPLDISSPIGQEELVRQLGSMVLNIIRQTNNQQVVDELTVFTEQYYAPLMSRKRGMSFSQDLYVLGSINEMAYLKTAKKEYLEAAKKYFEKAVEVGPNRPQALYGAFDIYRLGGDVENVKKTAEKILSLWPEDEKTKQLLAEFLANPQKGAN